jgi:rare lipoprotein A
MSPPVFTHFAGRTKSPNGYWHFDWTANQCQWLIFFERTTDWPYPGAMKRKFAAVLAVILMVCAWHACCYDRATWYGGSDRGKLMANGRPFNPDALTAASWNYPLGCRLKIVYGGKSVRVEVTDRGGKRAFMQFGKVVDLSHAAFARLEKPEVGSIRVKILRED